MFLFKKSQFFNFQAVFFGDDYPALLWSDHIPFIVKKLFCLLSVSFDAILSLLIIVIKFCKEMDKVFDVNNVCCYCRFILLFVFTCFLINSWSHQSNAECFIPLSYLCWRQSFCSHAISFLKRIEILAGFSICSSFGRHLCQKCGRAGSELYVQTHITEPPWWISKTQWLVST